MNNDTTDVININVGDNQEVNMEVLGNESLGFEFTTSSGTNNYERLSNKPQINLVELIGNKTSEDLGLQPEGDYANTRVTNLEIDDLFR